MVNIQRFEDELISCIEEGNVLKLREILHSNEIDANEKMSNGESLLHLAVRDGQAQIVEFLLRHEASTTSCDGNGNIALHLAVKRCRLIIGESLLRQQVNEQLIKRNNAGQTALDLMEINHSKDQWLILVQRCINDTRQNPQSNGIAGESLVELDVAGLSIKLQDGYGITPNVAGAYIGKLYQLNTLVFLSLRGYENQRHFRLATEVAEFDKFDDVVFDCGGLQVMQVKHRSKGKLIDKFSIFEKPEYQKQASPEFSVQKYLEAYCEKLGAETKNPKKEGDFSLVMYFRSYHKFDEGTRELLKEIIILTNTKFSEDDDLEKYFQEDPLDIDHILYVSGHPVKRYKIIQNSISRNPIVQGFIEKFRFVLNYPNEEELESRIRAQISETFKKKNSDLVSNSFFNQLQDWFKTLASRAIDRKMISDIYEEILEKLEIVEGIGLHQSNYENLNLSKISFVEGCRHVDDFLRDQSKKILIVSTPSMQLTAARVVKHLRSCLPNDDDFLFILSENVLSENSKFSKLIPRIFKSPKGIHLLVTLCENETEFQELLSEFQGSLGSDTKKKLIFITNKIDLMTEFMDCRRWTDEASFLFLSEESKNYFTQKEIYFQGRKVSIGEIMSRIVVNEVFEPKNIYESLISKFELEIRSDWQFPFQDTHINRRLAAMPNLNIDPEVFPPDAALCYEESHFYAPRSGEKIIIVCGDPGSGKSCLLNNMQLMMNRISNNVWAIKLNLNDFAQNEKKENHFSRIDFSETETQKAIAFLSKMVSPESVEHPLSLCGQLTRKLLIASLKGRSISQVKLPKVVILFDGFDEISPKYSLKVIQFLRALHRTNIQQIWISTRKHETEKIYSNLTSAAYELAIELNENQFFLAKNVFSKIGSLFIEENPLKIILTTNELNSAQRIDEGTLSYNMPKVIFDNNKFLEISFFETFRPEDLGFFEIVVGGTHFTSKPVSDSRANLLKMFSNIIQIIFPASTEAANADNSIYLIGIPKDFSSLNSKSRSESSLSVFIELENSFTSTELIFDFNEAKFHLKAIVSDAKVLTLLSLTKADQAEYLSNYCRVNRSNILLDDWKMKLENLFTLFKVIDFNCLQYSSEILRLIKPESTDFDAFFTSRLGGRLKFYFEKFLSIPLFLKLLVQLAAESDFKCIEDINLHQIFDEFIKLKERIYLKEKQKLGANADESYEASVHKAQTYHRLMARVLLLDEKTEDHEMNFTRNEQMLYKFGLTVYREGKLEFVHRSFAEYVFAAELWETIRHPTTQRLLFEKVLVEESNFLYVRTIFDSLLIDKLDAFASISMPLPLCVSQQRRNALAIACNNIHVNTLKFFLKTLSSQECSCYEFFKPVHRGYANLIQMLFSRNEGLEVLSDASCFNRCTLNCFVEALKYSWADDLVSFHMFIAKFKSIASRFLDFKGMLLSKDELGNSVLHNYKLYDKTFDVCKAELDSEDFENLLVHRNFKGETILTECEDIELDKVLSSSSPDEIKFFQENLIEKFNIKGYSILINEKNEICSETLMALCEFMQLSEDFLIITIFDNLFHSMKSLERILLHFTSICSKPEANSNLGRFSDSITSLIQGIKVNFNDKLVKLNGALNAESSEEVELVLRASEGIAPQIVLACDYKQESILRNYTIISSLMRQLEKQNPVVFHFWILRLPFVLIKSGYDETFERIFTKVLKSLSELESSERYTFLLHYIWSSIACNCRLILQVILNSIEKSLEWSRNDLLLYGNQIILRYDIDVSPEYEIINETKDLLFQWLFTDVESYPHALLMELLMYSAEYKLRISLSETLCRERLFCWLDAEVKSITRVQMHKILFAVARFGFKTIIHELIDWIERRSNDLPFRMIDVIQYRDKLGRNALHLAVRDGFLNDILVSFKNSNFNIQLQELLLHRDLYGSTFMWGLTSWNDLKAMMIFTIKEFGWDFLLTKNYASITFINAYCSQEYFIKILSFLLEHVPDLEDLRIPVSELLNEAAKHQENFIQIIDFMLKHFKSQFEEQLFRKSRHEDDFIFHCILQNEKSRNEILHHLAANCGSLCRQALTTFVEEIISNSNSENDTICRIIEFVFMEFPEDEVQHLLHKNVSDYPKFLHSLQEYEDLLLKSLKVLDEKCCHDDWRAFYETLSFSSNQWSNESFLCLLSMAIVKQGEQDLETFLHRVYSGGINILHIAYSRGIALRSLRLLPKEFLKDLLSEIDFCSRTPFNYLSLDENIEDLIRFLTENLNENHKLSILQKLGYREFSDFDNQLMIYIQNSWR